MMKSKVTKDMVYFGESAFSHYSFINPPKVPVYAIHKSKIKDIELQTELIVEKEQVKIEVWNNEPTIFSKNILYVDTLSSITTLLDFDDERLDLKIDNLF